MNGIVINIDPVALHFGGMEIRWYSLIIMLAIVTGTLISIRIGKKKGIPSEEILTIALFAVIAGFLGARLFHILDHWGYFSENPTQIFRLDQGGLAQWGALTGGISALIAYARVRHIPLFRLLDIVAPGVLVGLIIGRFACIVNGDAYGGVTGLPWGFIYTNPHSFVPNSLAGIPTHPYPVYEMLWNSAVLVIVLSFGRRYLAAEGSTFFSFLGLYSLGRLLLSFVRQEKEILWGLQEAQVVAAIILVVSVIMLFYLNRHSSKSMAPDTVSEAV